MSRSFFVVALLAALPLSGTAAPAGTSNPKPLREFRAPNGIHRLALSPDGKHLVLGLEDGPILLLDGSTLELRQPIVRERVARPECLSISPDGGLLAAGTFDGFHTVWTLPGGVRTQRVSVGGPADASAFSPDGLTLVTYSPFAGVIRWDARSGARRGTVALQNTGESVVPNESAFSEDGSTLAVSSVIDTDHSVRVWDAATGKLRRHFKEYPKLVDALALSRDGSRLITGSQDGIVRVHDVASGKTVASWKIGGFVTAVTLSRDGRLAAASTDNDPEVKVWDTAASRLLSRLPGHPDGARDLAFSADGSRLVSAAFATAKLWELKG